MIKESILQQVGRQINKDQLNDAQLQYLDHMRLSLIRNDSYLGFSLIE